MTYTEITDLINSTIRTKVAINSISPTNTADMLQDVLDFANDNIGGGSTPGLQAVTDVDNSTTNTIVASSLTAFNASGSGLFHIYKDSTLHSNIDAANITANRSNSLPDSDGTFAVSVNGNAADATGNITISGGGTDTNFANTDLIATGNRVHSFTSYQLKIVAGDPDYNAAVRDFTVDTNRVITYVQGDDITLFGEIEIAVADILIRAGGAVADARVVLQPSNITLTAKVDEDNISNLIMSGASVQLNRGSGLKDLVTSVNGTDADADGNVTISIGGSTPTLQQVTDTGNTITDGTNTATLSKDYLYFEVGTQNNILAPDQILMQDTGSSQSIGMNLTDLGYPKISFQGDSVDHTVTVGAKCIQFPRLTTTDRDSLSPNEQPCQTIYNLTTNQFEYFGLDLSWHILGGGTTNHIALQSINRNVPASSNVGVSDTLWDRTINNQPLKIEVSGFWAATTASHTYNILGVFQIGSYGYGFSFPIDSGTAQQGIFKSSFTIVPNPDGTSDTMCTFEYMVARDDSFSGYNTVQFNALDSSNYAARTDLGDHQGVSLQTPAGISFQNCNVALLISDPSL